MALNRKKERAGDPPVRKREIPKGRLNSWRAAIFCAVLDGVFSTYPAHTFNCGVGEKQHFLDVEAMLGEKGLERFHCIQEGWLGSVTLFVFILAYQTRNIGPKFYSNLALLIFGAFLLLSFLSFSIKAYKGNFDGFKGFFIVSGFLGSIYLLWRLVILVVRLLIRLFAG